MSLGHKHGHIDGKLVAGGHTTVIQEAELVVRALEHHGVFTKVRPGVISSRRGHHKSLIMRVIRDGQHEHTLRLLFFSNHVKQEIDLLIDNLQERLSEIIPMIIRISQKKCRCLRVCDCTQENP